MTDEAICPWISSSIMLGSVGFVGKGQVEIPHEKAGEGPLTGDRKCGRPALGKGQYAKLLSREISQGSTDGETDQASPTLIEKPGE